MENKLIIGPDYLFLISSQYETRFIDYTLKTIKTKQKKKRKKNDKFDTFLIYRTVLLIAIQYMFT